MLRLIVVSGETPGTAVVDCGNPTTPAFAFQVGNSGQATFSVNFTSFRIQNCNVRSSINRMRCIVRSSRAYRRQP